MAKSKNEFQGRIKISKPIIDAASLIKGISKLKKNYRKGKQSKNPSRQKKRIGKATS